jgi:hypothetical protein
MHVFVQISSSIDNAVFSRSLKLAVELSLFSPVIYTFFASYTIQATLILFGFNSVAIVIYTASRLTRLWGLLSL